MIKQNTKAAYHAAPHDNYTKEVFPCEVINLNVIPECENKFENIVYCHNNLFKTWKVVVLTSPHLNIILVETRSLNGEEVETNSILPHEAVKSVSGPTTCASVLIARHPCLLGRHVVVCTQTLA